MDKIIVKDLEVYAHHGVLADEKKCGQAFYLTVTMELDLHTAGITDDLTKTVNYAETCELIKQKMQETTYDLIEAAAENVAAAILLTYPAVRQVEVLLSKPHAPIPMEFDTVCVDIVRKRHLAYLGIGSNLGDKEAYLDYAIDQLNKDAYIQVKKVSSYFVTEPYGDVEQDDFLNGCLEIETLYSPQDLLAVVHDIEQGAGRKRIIHWGPRTLDIDILLYDDVILAEEDLQIPHIEMTKRQFVLEPLAEIAPYKLHPQTRKTILEHYEELQAAKA